VKTEKQELLELSTDIYYELRDIIVKYLEWRGDAEVIAATSSALIHALKVHYSYVLTEFKNDTRLIEAIEGDLKSMLEEFSGEKKPRINGA
jgi:hypothetical protein